MANMLFCTQVEQINLNANSVDSLISVDSDLDFDSLLPSYEYNGDIDISWAIPDSSLKKIDENTVRIYVSLDSIRNKSDVTFNYENERYASLHLILTCFVENSSCSSGSNLSKRVGITVVLDDLTSSINDTLVIRAYTKPPSPMVDVIKNREVVIAQAEIVRQIIESEPEILDAIETIIPTVISEQAIKEIDEKVQTFVLYTEDEAAKEINDPLPSKFVSIVSLVKQNETLPNNNESLNDSPSNNSTNVFLENMPNLGNIELPDFPNDIFKSDNLLKSLSGIFAILAILFIFMWVALKLLFSKKKKKHSKTLNLSPRGAPLSPRRRERSSLVH
jgi:hypothetical protein